MLATTSDDFDANYVGGDDGDGKLGLTETWIFEETGTAVAGTYSNLGTASGTIGATTVTDTEIEPDFGISTLARSRQPARP